MKTRVLFLLMALMSLAMVAPAQTKAPVKPPMKPPVQAPVKGKKTMPARDPKTGRFIKKTPAMKKMGKKTMPARDPKTGRFIKKTPVVPPKKGG